MRRRRDRKTPAPASESSPAVAYGRQGNPRHFAVQRHTRTSERRSPLASPQRSSRLKATWVSNTVLRHRLQREQLDGLRLQLFDARLPRSEAG